MRVFKFIFALGIAAAQNDYFVLEELTEGSTTTKEVICPSKGNCYPLYFQPTSSFQPVLPGQRVPKGLHIRMDYTTGMKEAKLLEPQQVPDTSINVFNNETDENTVADSGTNVHMQKEPDYKRPLNVQEHDSLAFIFGQMDSPTQELVEKLTDLAERAHDYDIGYAITKQSRYIEELFKMMKKDDLDLANVAALVLGSCVGNNPGAQRNVLELGPSLKSIFQLVVNCKDEMQCSRFFYLMAALIRDNFEAIQLFIELDPWKDLEKLIKYERSNQKLFRFLDDIIDYIPSDSLDSNFWCDKLTRDSSIWNQLSCATFSAQVQPNLHNEL